MFHTRRAASVSSKPKIDLGGRVTVLVAVALVASSALIVVWAPWDGPDTTLLEKSSIRDRGREPVSGSSVFRHTQRAEESNEAASAVASIPARIRGQDGGEAPPTRRTDTLNALLAALESAKGDDVATAVRNLWLFAADKGVPQEALAALDRAARSSDGYVASLAERAVRDLRELQARNGSNALAARVASSHIGPAERGREGSGRSESAAGSSGATDARVSELAESLQSPEVWVRHDAVRSLGNYRTERAAEILSTAVMDNDPSVRYAAAEALWRRAADSPPVDRENIELLLQRAAADPNQDVSALAQRALADLAALAHIRMPAEGGNRKVSAQGANGPRVLSGTE